MADEPAGGTPSHLAHLDGIRGLLALYVLAFHFLAFNSAGVHPAFRGLTAPLRFGHAAVDVFIVLSGYSLMRPVVASPGRTLRGGFRGYIKRRARRILPPYYAALALSIVVVAAVGLVERPNVVTVRPGELSVAGVVSHLLLVHNWVNGQSETINVPLWTVATEWQIYFLMPALLLPVWRRFGTAAMLASAFAAGLAPLAVLPPGHELFLCCPWYVGLFGIGMAGAVVASRPDHPLMRRTGALAALSVGSAGAYLALKWLRPGSDTGPTGLQWLKDAACGVVGFCALVACARMARPTPPGERRPWVLRLLESRPAAVLGGFSYSLYATHAAVLTACWCLTNRAGISLTGAFLVRAVVGLPLALGLGYLVSVGFERPFLNRPRSAAAGPTRRRPIGPVESDFVDLTTAPARPSL